MNTLLLAYDSCRLCPHDCKVNRNKGELGICGESAELRLAFAGLHFGEEPLITGSGGSGTIFVSGCNLGCAFCQNFQISQEKMGSVVSTEDFATICLRLEKEGAENINIVTGSHAIPALALGLKEAKKKGLSIPVCWNSSAYENVEALDLLKNFVDIWLPDLKTLDDAFSSQAFRAKNYPEYAKKAIYWMMEKSRIKIQKSTIEKKDSILEFESLTLPKMLQGLIVRHLILPNRLEDSFSVIQWFKENIDTKGYLSLMSQYTPIRGREKKIDAIKLMENRFLAEDELETAFDILDYFEIENGFYQELNPSDDWLPDFNQTQTFPNELAKPLWHWKYGFL
ncbi:MAG: radical SAM protein [Spirochaetota bacterium]|nr:radical SAM protein [Spirochaetota bacterium]